MFSVQQQRLVHDSFEIIQGMAQPVAMLFYGKLFQADPSLRPLFRGDMQVQSRKLMDMLQSAVASMGEFETMRPTLRELGSRHAQYGARPAHYATVCSSLIWALEKALEPGFDLNTRQAWTALLQAISDEMMVGAAQPVSP